MPRKQRFKPSRKPKPVPLIQAQEGAEIDRPIVRLEDPTRDRDPSRPDPGSDGAIQRREEPEAR